MTYSKASRLFIFLFLLITSSSAIPATDKPFYLSGYGLEECGDYLNSRNDDVHRNAWSEVYSSWFYGFKTGYNYAGPKEPSEGKIKKTTVLAYLDKYCRDNPLNTLFGAYSCLLKEGGAEIKNLKCD